MASGDLKIKRRLFQATQRQYTSECVNESNHGSHPINKNLDVSLSSVREYLYCLGADLMQASIYISDNPTSSNLISPGIVTWMSDQSLHSAK